MYSQSFSADEMWKCITPLERRNRKLTKSAFDSLWHTIIGSSIQNDAYKFAFKKVNGLVLNDKRTEDERFCQNLILRKISKNYRKLYYIKPSNRNAIIRDIISLLKEDNQYFVLRLDIKSFYESIDVQKCLTYIQDKERSSVNTIALTNTIFQNLPKSVKGLPRGISISAALSELYMKRFDNAIMHENGVVYYARFVDDIIIFTITDGDRKEILKKCNSELESMRLSLNSKKTIKWTPGNNTKRLYFLGYNFFIANNCVHTEIADDKLNKIKTRLRCTFRQYVLDSDFIKFEQRIKYLTGNFKFCVGNNFKKVHVGIRYNYKSVSEIQKQLIDLDTCYKRLLFSNDGWINTLTLQQKKALEKYSFLASYNNKIHHRFLVNDVLEIKKAWL